MDIALETKIVDDLREKLNELNAKYIDVIHFSVLTIANLKDLSCMDCTQMNRPCTRAVIGFKNETSELITACPEEQQPLQTVEEFETQPVPTPKKRSKQDMGRVYKYAKKLLGKDYKDYQGPEKDKKKK